MALVLFGCSSTPVDTELRAGAWRMELDLGERRLPFLFDLTRDSSGHWRMAIHNGDETIAVDDIGVEGASVRIRMPLFDSEFIGRIEGPSVFRGEWHNYLKGPEYRIPFLATAGPSPRFGAKPPARSDTGMFDGEWEVHFSPGTSEHYPALGRFHVERSGRATGTFITETGDYRYLEGVAFDDSLLLSGFDGAHAFLFGAVNRSDTLHGVFWSGTHWREPWIARRNPAFRLRDPDSLTYLREGYELIDFRFPDLEGVPVSPSDERFRGRVLVIQVMGSWCPNCVDETRLLNELYAKYHDSGLDVISLAFEKSADQERAIAALRRFRRVLGVRYPILYAGRASKADASEKLPFLNHVMSFPTCIIVDHRQRVRRIRTGIYGPGTGEHHLTYKRSLETFISGLLEESRSEAAAARH